MKTIIVFAVLLFALGLSACKDVTGPAGPQSFSEKTYNDLGLYTAKTSCDRQGISLNLTIESTVDNYFYPAADSLGHCMLITVFDRNDQEIITYSYTYAAWSNLFGAYELQPKFSYSGSDLIPLWDLPHDISTGRIIIRFWLDYTAWHSIYPVELSIRYDFGNL